MKLTSRAITILLLLLPALAVAQAPAGLTLAVNGRLIETDQPAMLVEDHLFIGSEVLASELGLQVSVDKGLWHVRCYGHELLLRVGERTYMADGTQGQSVVAPLQREDELYVPAPLVNQVLPLTITHEGAAWQVRSPLANLLQVRQGSHPDRVRFVLDLATPAAYRVYQEPGKVVLELPVAADQPEVLRLHNFDEAMASQVTESVRDGSLRIAISHESPEPPQFVTLADPARIVVDLLREAPVCTIVAKPTPVKPTPGDIWDVRRFIGSKGPCRGFVVRFDPAKTSWTLRPALAGQTIMQRRTVSRIAAANKAYAAVNGGFFAAQGPPLGLLVIDGEWVKAPLYTRAALGITREGEYHIANVDFDGRVEFEGLGMLPLDRLNEGHVNDNSVIAYTPRWGPVVVGAPEKTRLAVNADGVVCAVYPPNVDAPMPKGGFVLSGNGQRSSTLAGIAQGTKVKLVLETTPRWPGLWEAIGGGPLLVANGQVAVNGRAERFRDDVVVGCRPRTAVGLTSKGEVVLVSVEEPGMTLRELAGTMVRLGVSTGMNLDGGGSTAIVVNGRLLNAPSDGCERSVSNALLVVKR